MLCPCHSDHLFAECCQPLLDGKTMAATPEQLMRSRFSAYVLHNWHYLLKSWHPDSRPKCTIEELENDAFSMVDRLDLLTSDEDNHFTREDVLAALELYNEPVLYNISTP